MHSVKHIALIKKKQRQYIESNINTDNIIFSQIDLNITFFNNKISHQYDEKEIKSILTDESKNGITVGMDNVYVYGNISVKRLVSNILYNISKPLQFFNKINMNKIVVNDLYLYNFTPYLTGTINYENILQPPHYSIYKFNNAIVETNKYDFTMLYRAYWKGNYSEVTNNIEHINSIWNNKPYSSNFNFIANTIGKCNLKFDPETKTFTIGNDAICDNLLLCEDPRLFKKSTGDINVMVSMPLCYKNLIGRNTTTLENKIILALYDLDSSESLQPYDMNICSSICAQYEKNWTIFEFESEIYFLYSLYDELVIHYEKDNYKFINQKTPNFLAYVQKITNDNILFSGGSPAIDYFYNVPGLNCNHKLKIAMGHVKVSSSYAMQHDIIDNCNKYCKSYIYFMFFYTFDPLTGKLYGLSDCFIPCNKHLDNMPYALVFPLSIVDVDDDYIVSYGEGDIRCKALIINKKNVILKNINNMNSINDLHFCYYIGQNGTTTCS